MDKLKNIPADIKAGWEKLEKKKRTQLVTLVAGIIILLFVLVYFTQRTEYKVLFSELEEADAGAIVEDLEAKGMEYRLERNGTTILIDKDKIDEYRIAINNGKCGFKTREYEDTKNGAGTCYSGNFVDI